MSAEGVERDVIDEFRANEGRVGGVFEGTPILLLHHTGARSGAQRVSPVAYLEDRGRYVIFADDERWYDDVKANPTVTIEVGTDTFEALAQEVGREERDRLRPPLRAQSVPAIALTPGDIIAERDQDPSG
jgi:deazaflavin-dependent oxidoreductase (nitroreductase family)